MGCCHSLTSSNNGKSSDSQQPRTIRKTGAGQPIAVGKSGNDMRIMNNGGIGGTKLEEISFMIIDPNNVPQDGVFGGGKGVLNTENSRLGASSRRLSS